MTTRNPSPAEHVPSIGRTPVFFYYGTALPERRQARKLRNATIVLQPYHPLCQTDGFADYFPHARRFVYFNPTAVQPGLVTDTQARAATLGYDAVWDLDRLDLRNLTARHFAITQGQLALRIQGIDGLFVDDLDQWDHPEARPYARAVLDAIMTGHTGPVAWFVNRGFGFWPGLPRLAATLLENLSPYQLDRMTPNDLAWVTAVVLPALRHASTRGAEIHCLTYDPAAVGWQPRGPAARAVATAAGEPLLEPRLLDRWPQSLTRQDLSR